MSAPRAGVPETLAVVDTYGPSNPTTLEGIYKRPVFIQGKKEAVQLAGLGVAMTSILAGAAMRNAWSPVVMIGGMIAGLAIMAAAAD